MKTLFFIMLAGGVLSGCIAQRAEMVETRGDQIALFRSPTERPGRGGIIRYNDRGKKSWRQARREDAERRMETFCHGGYTITTEGPRSDFQLRNGMIDIDPLDPNRYIGFDCAKAAEPTLLERLKQKR